MTVALRKFHSDGDRSDWPRLEAGYRYPLRRRAGYLEVVARKIGLNPDTLRRHDDGRCYYTIVDDRGRRYEQNDFAVLSRIDYGAGVFVGAPEQLAFDFS